MIHTSGLDTPLPTRSGIGAKATDSMRLCADRAASRAGAAAAQGWYPYLRQTGGELQVSAGEGSGQQRVRDEEGL